MKILNSKFSITKTGKKQIPRIQYEKTKNAILGEDYELSLVFCGDALSRRLNRAYRGKDLPADVLSFPLSKVSGEIFLNLSRTRKFGVEKLFVHACLHLKGMEHGDKMEQAEGKFLRAIARKNSRLKNGTPNRSRH